MTDPKPSTVHEIVVLPGDGIGVDVTRETLRVLGAVEAKLDDVSFRFSEHAVGAAEYLRNGSPLPESAFAACRAADAVLLGAMGLPSVRWPDGREMTPQIDLRERLDLYAGPRPIRLQHGDDSPLKGYKAGEIDFVIVRENTEGLFAARTKNDLNSEQATDLMLLTRKGCERVIRFAFELARKRRKHCTLVDKANVLPSMVFMRRIFDEIAGQYPDVVTDRIYVDAMAQFDRAEANPGEDFFSALAQATYRGRRLTREEMMGFGNLAFAGGRDTIIHSISSIVGYLGQNPTALEYLRADPKRIVHAGEEFFRAFMPLTHIGRVCPVATEVHGAPVKAGGRVSLGWAAANFDEEVFECPEEIRLDRKPNPHISFGFGTHLCLGAPHARLIVRCLLQALVARVAKIEVAAAEQHVEKESHYQRAVGYESLTVRFTGRQ